MTRLDDEARDLRVPADQAPEDPIPELSRPHTPAQPADVDFMETLGDDAPDIGFTLTGGSPTPEPEPEPEPDVAEQAKALNRRIAAELVSAAPPGWQQLHAVFASTVAAELTRVLFSNGENTVQVQPPAGAISLVREQRDLAAQLGDGPWWRMTLSLSASGQLDVEYDYGDEPFPDDQLFAPEAYRADLETYPRARLPVWLAAYIRNEGRQSRSPQQAAVAARSDLAAGIRPTRSDNDFPDFPEMWVRWAIISAAFVACKSQWGPRVLASLGLFEGARRSGSTLYALPGGRAVLSGGVWNAPELDAAYNDGAPMPQLYAGAPEWIANPVLNPRAATGLLSFCYWWDNGRWYRGDSPAAAALASALPGIWTVDTVVDVVSALIADEPTADQRAAVSALVTAAEAGVANRALVAETFGDTERFDVDGALYQLTVAGVLADAANPMPRLEAIDQVRRHIRDTGLEAPGYTAENLRAERVSVGWMVYAPTPPGELSIGRTLFYIADDGVLERSSSAVAPAVFMADFERRFAERHP
ncbi:hypothetical protein [Nocardia sp. NPDC050406]|uniref:hypothetical protein n=1 Tax=Nocardia sp. NPDC050406 TaxID=3364318 RepID=UPI003798B890